MSGVRFLAGETGFEPAAYGFGDRCSAVELHPIIQKYETRSAAAGGFQCFHTDEETVQVTLSALSAVQPAATPRIYRLVYRQRMKGYMILMVGFLCSKSVESVKEKLHPYQSRRDNDACVIESAPRTVIA